VAAPGTGRWRPTTRAPGGSGPSGSPSSAHWFVARMLKTAPVSREMVLNFVAQNSLGLPRSY
jgi:hypothetical protein